jgi:hypothetical protein
MSIARQVGPVEMRRIARDVFRGLGRNARPQAEVQPDWLAGFVASSLPLH